MLRSDYPYATAPIEVKRAILSTLHEARFWINRGWCQGSSFKNKSGRELLIETGEKIDSSKVAKVCLVGGAFLGAEGCRQIGAFNVAYIAENVLADVFADTKDGVEIIEGKIGNGHHDPRVYVSDIIAWNDRKGQRKAHVLALVDTAIQKYAEFVGQEINS